MADITRPQGDSQLTIPEEARELVPVTPWAWRRQHLARIDQLCDDPNRPGRYGRSLCNQDSGRMYDQEWMTAELERWSDPPLAITDLPLCRRCQRSAELARAAELRGGAQ